MESSEYEAMFRMEDDHWWYRALRRILFRNLDQFVPDWRRQPILDAGCGAGANLIRLGKSELHVGVDLAPEALEFCRQRGLAQLVRANVCDLPFTASAFAAVISTSVLYHRWVPDPATAIREFHRVLRPRGHLFLDVPAHSWLQSEHDERVHTARRFTIPRLRSLLDSNGFDIVRMTHWNTLPLPAIWLARRWRLLPSGRDFDADRRSGSWVNEIMNAVMASEYQLTRVASLPLGVSLSCVARKSRLLRTRSSQAKPSSD